jgi:cytochrome c-type biogenesis protein CcmE
MTGEAENQHPNHDDTSLEVPQKRPMQRRKKRRLIIAIAVVIIALLIIFMGWNETGNRSYVSVSQLLAEEELIASNSSKYCNVLIEVQGIVSDWDGTSNSFHLVDKQNASQFIIVNMTAVFPDGFANGKTVVVKGRLSNSMPITLIGSGVTIGCSSKY